MKSNVRGDKAHLRAKLLRRRSQLSQEERRRSSSRIAGQLHNLDEFRRARSVMLYVAVRGEVETGASIKACLEVGKRTFIPWCDPSSKKIRAAEITDYEADLVASTYGIPAPPEERLNFAPAREVELFIVPGIGFDWAGARLGWGKGYYDLFLSSADPAAVKIALAYEFQLLPHIKQVSHDVLMGKVITEDRVIDCRKVRDNIVKVRKYSK